MKREKAGASDKEKPQESGNKQAKTRDNYSQVYQFKISLLDIKPLIWRRIQVPENYTFWDLHVAIQSAMGWSDSHLHQFTLIDPITKERILVGQPETEYPTQFKTLVENKIDIAKWFSPGRKNAGYEYDFGDGWLHKVTFEKLLPREKDVKYPRCLGGARACPPEDCGGPWGYQELCEGTSEVQEYYEDLDPEYFDLKDIDFEDPDARYKEVKSQRG